MTITVRSVWETVGACVHAQRELACTANISIAHERIFVEFLILLSDNNDKSKITPQLIDNGNNSNNYINITARIIISLGKTFGTCVHSQYLHCS